MPLAIELAAARLEALGVTQLLDHSGRAARNLGTLPEGSYGRRNRQAIAASETRVATQLRAVDHAYRTAIDRGATFSPPEPSTAPSPPKPPADREIELE